MGEGHSLRTFEYFSLGHICLPDLQQMGPILEEIENYPS